MAKRVDCAKCCQCLGVERDGRLHLGDEMFDEPIRLKCRLCGKETEWLPARLRSKVEVVSQPANDRVKGLWVEEAA